MRKISLTIICSVFAIALTNAQVKSKDELKTERQSLNAEQHTAAYATRQQQVNALSAPSSTGIGGVDALVDSSNSMLALNKKNKEALADLYKRTTDSSLKMPAKEELYALSNSIAAASNGIAKIAKDLLVLQDDDDNAAMLKQANVVQSITYVQNVHVLLAEEIAFQIKLFNNLMATYKLNQ